MILYSHRYEIRTILHDKRIEDKMEEFEGYREH